MAHSHAPATITAGHRKRLIIVLIVTGTVVIFQLVGALISGSLALLADAGHCSPTLRGAHRAHAITLAKPPRIHARACCGRRSAAPSTPAAWRMAYVIVAAVLQRNAPA